MNRYHLLGTYFNQVGGACNCNPVFGLICIVELGRNVAPLMPLEYNNLYAKPEDIVFRDTEDALYDVNTQCYPDMPDFFYCIWLNNRIYTR